MTRKPIEKGIFVFAETVNGTVTDVVFELLGKARELAAQLDVSVTAVMAGDGAFTPWKQLSAHGADYIVLVKNPALSQYLTLPCVRALAEAVRLCSPEIFLFGATPIGRDLAPRLSARLSTGLTADCTGLEIEDGSGHLLMTRPAFGGNLMATIICADHRPQMATVRPGVMVKQINEAAQDAQLTVLDVNIPDSDARVEILESASNPPARRSIREAKVLISGGRGMGSQKNFSQLERIADLLGGTIASSRAAVDIGWQTKDRQVGQTGQTVRPDVYIACGISGAIQHLAGMEESGFIVAINKDEAAPILGVADLGIIGDVMTVLPALEEALRAETVF
ncbi:MAG: electron transfer flavoprotein subunit alpha/FixB family protein [Oscillospiraceae bacterium]|jgi:electron transfer flavoprotein alpha subunit|nr:electron transfer flavoprotein subunit alpha/FixB family protein [Oscillospiraceae bacterium]